MITWEEAEAAGLDEKLKAYVGKVYAVGEKISGVTWFDAEVIRCSLVRTHPDDGVLIGWQFRAYAKWLPDEGVTATTALRVEAGDTSKKLIQLLTDDRTMFAALLDAFTKQKLKVGESNGNSTDC